GMLGKYDEPQLQRGFRVYTEVCSRCHGIKRIAFRNLVQPGGPEFPEAGVKSLAADNYKVDAQTNDQVNVHNRPAALSDHTTSRFTTTQYARPAWLAAASPPSL